MQISKMLVKQNFVIIGGRRPMKTPDSSCFCKVCHFCKCFTRYCYRLDIFCFSPLEPPWDYFNPCLFKTFCHFSHLVHFSIVINRRKHRHFCFLHSKRFFLWRHDKLSVSCRLNCWHSRSSIGFCGNNSIKIIIIQSTFLL